MNVALLAVRILHVGLGTFWAGTMIFNAMFLFPAMRDAGPDGAKVAAGIMRRGFMNLMPVVGIFTILTGFYLIYRASAGFGPGYMGTGPGIGFSTGMLASIIALALGLAIVRPAMLKAGALSQQLPGAAAADRERLMAEAQALRARAGRSGQAVAWLLGVAVVAMAVARYL